MVIALPKKRAAGGSRVFNNPVVHFRLNVRFRVPPPILHRFTAALLLAIAPALLSAQVQRTVSTAKGSTFDTPVPHPLSWWTNDPLRLDASGDLMIGASATDGKIVTAEDYRVSQEVIALGTVAGLRIVQLVTTIIPGARIVASGWASAGEPATQWKSLLVQDGTGDRYIEIYELQAESGLYQSLKPAAIYGDGPDSILGTYDPDSGNGGGCDDGYWWFDKAGVHAVDFSPLNQAISRAIPPNSTYTSNCWALHPEKGELQSWVQRTDAECHACGGLGTVYAQYKIQRGVAIPVSVRFEPENQ
jgi:hypothetical protein